MSTQQGSVQSKKRRFQRVNCYVDEGAHRGVRALLLNEGMTYSQWLRYVEQWALLAGEQGMTFMRAFDPVLREEREDEKES